LEETSAEEQIRPMGDHGQAILFASFLTADLIDPAWTQFRFSVGAPEAEAKFNKAVADAQNINFNARKYPSLYVSIRSWMRISIDRVLGFPRIAAEELAFGKSPVT
jgi:hypothetical protein